MLNKGKKSVSLIVFILFFLFVFILIVNVKITEGGYYSDIADEEGTDSALEAILNDLQDDSEDGGLKTDGSLDVGGTATGGAGVGANPGENPDDKKDDNNDKKDTGGNTGGSTSGGCNSEEEEETTTPTTTPEETTPTDSSSSSKCRSGCYWHEDAGVCECPNDPTGGYQPDDQGTTTPTTTPTTSCFLAGTPVALSDGTEKPIEDIKIGDIVLGYDLNANKPVNVKVLELESPIRDDYYIIKFEDGSKLEVTNEHPIYIRNNVYLGWGSIIPKVTLDDAGMVVNKINIGDEVLKLDDRWVRIKSVTHVLKRIRTYNLKKVSKTNTFFAGDVLVHNKVFEDPDPIQGTQPETTLPSTPQSVVINGVTCTITGSSGFKVEDGKLILEEGVTVTTENSESITSTGGGTEIIFGENNVEVTGSVSVDYGSSPSGITLIGEDSSIEVQTEGNENFEFQNSGSTDLNVNVGSFHESDSEGNSISFVDMWGEWNKVKVNGDANMIKTVEGEDGEEATFEIIFDDGEAKLTNDGLSEFVGADSEKTVINYNNGDTTLDIGSTEEESNGESSGSTINTGQETVDTNNLEVTNVPISEVLGDAYENGMPCSPCKTCSDSVCDAVCEQSRPSVAGGKCKEDGKCGPTCEGTSRICECTELDECKCTSWVDWGCGGISCSPDEREEYRSCYPKNCDDQYQCKQSQLCESKANGCLCGDWSNKGPSKLHCPAGGDYYVRTCVPYECGNTDKCGQSEPDPGDLTPIGGSPIQPSPQELTPIGNQVVEEAKKAADEGLSGDDCWDATSNIIYNAAGATWESVYTTKNNVNVNAPEDEERDYLVPGDLVQYPEENSPTGAHNVIFLGWVDEENGIAEVAQQSGANEPITIRDQPLVGDSAPTIIWQPIPKLT